MEKLNILFGFSDSEYEAAVKALIRSKGYEANIIARFSKESIKAYIEQYPDTDAVVILETFPKSKENNKPQKYTAEEVAQLTDNSDVNVILVLSENYKGTDYVRTLFAAGITSAFFQKRGSGARPRDIAALILQKRTRKAARIYYGISNQKIELGFLETDVFNDYYERFQKISAETSPLESYLTICSGLTPQQIEDFTRRLPQLDRDYLAQFEEFHSVMQLLKKFGIDMKIKRPRRVNIGLSRHIGISVDSDRVVIEKENTPAETVTEEKKKPQKAKIAKTSAKADKQPEKKEVEQAVVPEVVPKVVPEAKEDIKADIKEEDKAQIPTTAPIVGLTSMADWFSFAADDGEDDIDDIVEETFVLSKEPEVAPVAEPVVAPTEVPKAEPVMEQPVAPVEEPVVMPVVEQPVMEPQAETPVTKTSYVDEFEDEPEQENVTFEDIDDAYDRLMLESGGRRVSVPLIIAILLFAAIIAFVLLYGRSQNFTLF